MAGVDRERLVAARKLNGFSQDGAAREIGVTTGAVKNWEAGRRTKISGEDLSRIADAYGCTTDWLLGRTDVGPVKRATPPNGDPGSHPLDELDVLRGERRGKRSTGDT